MKKFHVRPLVGIALIFIFLVTVALVIAAFLLQKPWLLLPAFGLGVTLLLLHDFFQPKHSLLRNFPVVGRSRYLMERLRAPLRQYFFESDLNGKPFNRRQRSIIYQRSKNVRETVAFGMQADPYEPGYEWVTHSIYPVKTDPANLRITIGSSQCQQPYSLSILNIGAMSYGALSKTAIRSLSEGAHMADFAMNTGEGGISPYHISGGADLIWQIGTGYFGCRNLEGAFDPELFRRNATRPYVKMIEVKLSQGAKPGHGGLLPAVKNTPDIAAIRHVIPGTTVHSPNAHSAFKNSTEMVLFLSQLRALSGGKPVGFKLCIGNMEEFEEICKTMANLRIYVDFISVDGAEGGTGAAPLEFTDYVGMPLFDAVAFARKTIDHYGLPTRIIASGKIVTAFDILRVIALGASACYSARGMMMSLGCIQALQCDSGTCPVGIATQDRRLYRGIDIADKRVRVCNFHQNTLKAVADLMEACGFRSLTDVTADNFHRRITRSKTMSLKEIYFNDRSGLKDQNEMLSYLN
ncbi:MAG TPA: FMN-binding glutamate synthase family protein [Sphingobacteriaceae bacterium]